MLSNLLSLINMLLMAKIGYTYIGEVKGEEDRE